MHTPIITASDAEGAGEMFQVRLQPHTVRSLGICVNPAETC